MKPHQSRKITNLFSLHLRQHGSENLLVLIVNRLNPLSENFCSSRAANTGNANANLLMLYYRSSKTMHSSKYPSINYNNRGATL